jgi:hypothetical protein
LVVLLGVVVETGSIIFGLTLLLAFAAGRAIPILLGAVAVGWLESIKPLARYRHAFHVMWSVVLIVAGLYMLNASFLPFPSSLVSPAASSGKTDGRLLSWSSSGCNVRFRIRLQPARHRRRRERALSTYRLASNIAHIRGSSYGSEFRLQCARIFRITPARSSLQHLHWEFRGDVHRSHCDLLCLKPRVDPAVVNSGNADGARRIAQAVCVDLVVSRFDTIHAVAVLRHRLRAAAGNFGRDLTVEPLCR